MNLIDSHFHLDLWKNPKYIISEIEKKGIYTIAVTNAPSVYGYTLKLTEGLKFIRPALGYHPEVISQRPNDLSLFNKYLNQTRYIGEIGLDYACSVDKQNQKRIFTHIISACSEYSNKVITIHSRRAEADVIDIVNKDFQNTIILHWYSGNLSNLKKAIDYGFYFSINHQMARSTNGQKIIKNIPLERILTESDGPFTTINKLPSSPLHMSTTVKEIARIYEISYEKLNTIIYHNFYKILSKKC